MRAITSTEWKVTKTQHNPVFTWYLGSLTNNKNYVSKATERQRKRGSASNCIGVLKNRERSMFPDIWEWSTSFLTAAHTQQAFTEVNPHTDVLHGLWRWTLRHSKSMVFCTWFQSVGLSLTEQDKGVFMKRSVQWLNTEEQMFCVTESWVSYIEYWCMVPI